MKRVSGLEPLELATIGRQMLRLARGLAVNRQADDSPPDDQLQSIFSSLARDEISERQARRAQFGIDLFGEPSWEMLLHLYIAHIEGTPLSTKAVLAASGAPTTTALRHLSVLELERLITRRPSEQDQRVVLVELSERGFRKFQEYFLSRLEVADYSASERSV